LLDPHDAHTPSPDSLPRGDAALADPRAEESDLRQHDLPTRAPGKPLAATTLALPPGERLSPAELPDALSRSPLVPAAELPPGK